MSSSNLYPFLASTTSLAIPPHHYQHQQRELALQAEHAETVQWIEGSFGVAPDHVREALGLATSWVGDLAMVQSRHIPFCHFNMVLSLGCPAVPDDAAFAAMDAFYGGRQHFVMVPVGQTEPSDMESLLLARNYQHNAAWDRVILHDHDATKMQEKWAQYAKGCEMVSIANADEWSSFILKCYNMPPLIADWLKAYVGHKGWYHALLREGGKADGAVIMVRSLYFHEESGWAWLGVDAPVPGVMAPCYDIDQKVTAALLHVASMAGARSFVSDIEAPADDEKGPAYDRWEELGFSVAYRRNVFTKGKN
jgi:hypothetical protein